MDNKDFNRDQLLNEILRETAAPRSQPAPQPAPARDPEPPKPASAAPAARPAPAEPVRPAAAPQTQQQPAAETPAPEPDNRTVLFNSAQWNTDQVFTARQPVLENDPLYEDLEGESQPFRPESVHSTTASTAKRPRKKRKQHRVISALAMIIIIIGVSILLSSALIVYGRDLLGINSDSSTKIVTIPQGATMKEIAGTLQDSGIITKPDFFVFIVGMSDKDKDIKPGDHELRPDMAYETILSELISDPMDSSLSVSVTFPEGMRLVDAADLLEENNVCDADEFLDYFNHSSNP